MANYIGYRCPVCGKAFAQGDDIVVCPECGAPHHRGCWRELGRCAHEEKHSAGEVWSASAPDPGVFQPADQAAALQCPRCGSHNPAGNIFCQVCGQQLTAGQFPPQPATGAYPGGWSDPGPGQGQGYRPAGQEEPFPPPAGDFQWLRTALDEYDRELSPGVSWQDICDYVGPNGYVFLLRFQQLMEPGVRISVNLPAFFFSFFYCFYRKMYRLGAVLLGITVASFLPAFWCAARLFSELMATQGAVTLDALMNLNSPAVQQLMSASAIFRMVTLVVMVFCGFCFNGAYCRRVLQEIRATKEHGHFSSGSPEYHYALAHRGGVNMSAVLLVVCTLLVAYILAVMGITYQLI